MNQSVKDNYIHNILELLERSAERFPDRPAFGDPEKDITFRELVRKARAAGELLAADVPVRQIEEGRNVRRCLCGGLLQLY